MDCAPENRLADDDSRWSAVVNRDPSADGAFYYGVRTTGVYCRPTCPSRRPKRENVVFFEQPADAERAGFRQCSRCRPGEGALGGNAREGVQIDEGGGSRG